MSRNLKAIMAIIKAMGAKGALGEGIEREAVKHLRRLDRAIRVGNLKNVSREVDFLARMFLQGKLNSSQGC